MNISSVIVWFKEGCQQNIRQELAQIQGVECHQEEAGKMIVTIQGENVSDEVKALRCIESLNGVISAEMVYSYSEEIQTQKNQIEGYAYESLNDTKKAEQLRYGGSVSIQLEEALKK
ncbi:hypothetical protein CCZ01_03955 [Helicobacter monodelphidis]|uniref:chaperone NapD n=1 Tax=Helicobacter sp. 15-1451 TaxID=2004995 RepID=UPI000DCD6696|nr:chaperone NapD [Helicobacter sp. 15-1451]RAX58234.1 hypothetical protein CCZ01_03955 [Helicobacter sp. 15-1451]